VAQKHILKPFQTISCGSPPHKSAIKRKLLQSSQPLRTCSFQYEASSLCCRRRGSSLCCSHRLLRRCRCPRGKFIAALLLLLADLSLCLCRRQVAIMLKLLLTLYHFFHPPCSYHSSFSSTTSTSKSRRTAFSSITSSPNPKDLRSG